MEYESPAMRIGKHDWRMIVVPIGVYPGKQTGYEFRPIGGCDWRPFTEWPAYDSEDDAWNGLPKRLAVLYRKHKADISAALNGQRSGLLALS